MTVFRRIVRLNMTQAQAEGYTPPRGIDVVWLEFLNDGTCFAELVACDRQPNAVERRTAADLATEVLVLQGLGRVNQPVVPSHPNSPGTILQLEGVLLWAQRKFPGLPTISTFVRELEPEDFLSLNQNREPGLPALPDVAGPGGGKEVTYALIDSG